MIIDKNGVIRCIIPITRVQVVFGHCNVANYFLGGMGFESSPQTNFQNFLLRYFNNDHITSNISITTNLIERFVMVVTSGCDVHKNKKITEWLQAVVGTCTHVFSIYD